ncbi:MAG: TIGR04255 family protein [Candidatus Tectomicrobia bacterium]|nr:TIGR04255 family protein [Candidatus Tectomicrobia bacterium]
MTQRRRYKNPPIEEALCEFGFAPGADWDPTIPGKLQAALGDEYSGKPKEQRAVQVGFRVQKDRPADLQYGEGLAKVQLFTKLGTRMVGVGPDVLSIHMLRPYQDPRDFEKGGWEEFRPRIVDALKAYRKVASPSGVNRVGVRYINKILVPLARVRVEDYLKCAYLEIDGLPEHYSNFISRVEYVYDDGVRLVLSYGLFSASVRGVECLLDLDVIWRAGTSIHWEESLRIADDLHERAGSAFEAVVTDQARELFHAG